MQWIAKTLTGLEPVLARELEEIGATNVEIHKRAIRFSGDNEILYKANMLCRTALSILKPVSAFTAQNEKELYDHAMQIEWDAFLDLDQTFSFDTTVYSSFFNHTKYPGLKCKDALCDYFRTKTNERPNVDTKNPSIRFHLHINQDQCEISINSSGKPLYFRGYRKEAVNAPMNEVLAAGLVQLSEWDVKQPLYNPMCGSGTIALEAGLHAAKVYPYFHRTEYGFRTWKDYDKNLERKIQQEYGNPNLHEGTIYATDNSYRATDIAKENFYETRLKNIWISKEDFFDSRPREKEGMLIINPPYDVRMQVDETAQLYKDMGDHLKRNYAGYKAWIISSNKEAMKHFGLRHTKKHKLHNGALECDFSLFELY